MKCRASLDILQEGVACCDCVMTIKGRDKGWLFCMCVCMYVSLCVSPYMYVSGCHCDMLRAILTLHVGND